LQVYAIVLSLDLAWLLAVLIAKIRSNESKASLKKSEGSEEHWNWVRKQKRLRQRKKEQKLETPILSQRKRGLIRGILSHVWREWGFRYVWVRSGLYKDRALAYSWKHLNGPWWKKSWFQLKTQHALVRAARLELHAVSCVALPLTHA
jgi:hypothetical protein